MNTKTLPRPHRLRPDLDAPISFLPTCQALQLPWPTGNSIPTLADTRNASKSNITPKGTALMNAIHALFAFVAAVRFEVVNFVASETHALVADELDNYTGAEVATRRAYHATMLEAHLQRREERLQDGLRDVELPEVVYSKVLMPLCVLAARRASRLF